MSLHQGLCDGLRVVVGDRSQKASSARLSRIIMAPELGASAPRCWRHHLSARTALPHRRTRLCTIEHAAPAEPVLGTLRPTSHDRTPRT